MSTKNKSGTWFVDINFHGEKRCVLLYQIRMMHSKRFTVKIGQVSWNDINLIKEKLETLLELSINRHPTEVEIDGYIPKTDVVYAEYVRYANIGCG
jgi:hypothetical protein